jgi:hypothetical protein
MLRRVTLLQVLTGEVQSPSMNDLRRFLIKEHSEENLEFYEAVKGYKDKFGPVFDSEAGVAALSPQALSAIKLECQHILDTYLKAESPREVNIDMTHRVPIYKAVSASIYDPKIFK